MLTRQVRMNNIALNDSSLTNIADDTYFDECNDRHCQIVDYFAAD
jgi:hypothetical protein